MSPRKAMRQSIQISRISDREDSPASLPMVSALAGKIEEVMKEMGLTATVTIAKNRSEARDLGGTRRTLVRRRRRTGNTPVISHPPGG